MEINEEKHKKLMATEEELEVPEGEDPLKYMEQLFGEPTPHDEMPDDDVNDEVYIIKFKSSANSNGKEYERTNTDENYSDDNCDDISKFESYISNAVYTSKQYESPCEQTYYKLINKVLSRDYVLIAQVCLSSIIDKKMKDGSKNFYRNELHRIVDFGVFDRNFNVRLLIEINDHTHDDPARQLRDQKVKLLLDKAGIELLTLKTGDGLDMSYIIKQLGKYAKPELQ